MIPSTFRNVAVGATSLACLAAVSAYSFSPSGDGAAEAQTKAAAEAPAVHRVDELKVGAQSFVRREILASSFRYDKQQFPAVALDRDGSFTVAWESRRQHHGYSGVYTQDFDAAGHRVGEEIEVEAGTRLHQTTASVLRAQSGTWVAWESFDLDGDGPSVRLRRLGSDASVKLDNGAAHHVTLAATADGVAAAWVNGNDERDSVFFARFAADGTPLTKAQRLSDAGENGSLPSLATLADGGLAVVWAAQDAQRLPDGLRYRVFDAKGEARGDVESLHGSNPAASIEPSVAACGEGFVVAWHDNREGSFYDVMARRFDAAGEPVAAAFVVSEARHHQSGATVAVATDGSDRICVAWNQAEDELSKVYDVRARLFDAAGAPLTDAFTAPSHTQGNQQLLVADNRDAVAFGAAGQLVFAWTGDADLGDKDGAHVTVCVPSDNALASATADLTLDLPAAQPADQWVQLKVGLLADADTQTQEAQQVARSGKVDPPIFTGHIAQSRGSQTNPLADAGFAGMSNTGWRPPDTHGTVGPTKIVEVVNGGIQIFDKNGTAGAMTSINNFWAPVGSQTFVFDPRVLFDSYTCRFIAIATEHVGSATGYLVVAVSTTDSPTNLTSHWHKYRFNVTADAGGYFVDFPQVGVDDKAIYLSTNNFNGGGGGSFSGHMIYILDKAPLLVGGAPAPRKLITNTGLTASLGMGVHHGTNNAAFAVNVQGNTTLGIFAIRNPIGGGAATLTQANLTVPSTSGGPADAPQIGTTNLLDSIDKRFSSIIVRNRRLYAAHNYGNPTRCRWYEIALNNWPVSGSPSLVQSGDVAPAGAFAIIPSVAVDAYGNILVNYTRSSASETPSQRRAARKPSDPVGTLPSQDVAIQSPTSYTLTRWGDYSHVAVDPRDQATFYYFHEYAPNATNWGTWVGKHRVQPPTFTANKSTMSTSILDTVTFTLNNPPWAGADYLVLVGASGRTPGFRLPSPSCINVDLKPDGLTSAGLSAPFSPPFGNFAGVLNGSGQATATFTLPPLPVLNGITFEFAYVQRQSGVWNFASETLSVLMVP